MLEGLAVLCECGAAVDVDARAAALEHGVRGEHRLGPRPRARAARRRHHPHATAVPAWVEGGRIGGFRQAPERQRRLSSAPKRLRF